MTRFRRILFFTLIICLLLVAGYPPYPAFAISSTAEFNGFTAVYNEDRTITIEGVSESKAGEKIRIQIDKSPTREFIAEYFVNVGDDGRFKLETAPVDADAVSVFIYAEESVVYALGVRAPWLKPRVIEGPDTMRLDPSDPALQPSAITDTTSEIRAKWRQYAPAFDYATDPFLTAPVTDSPYASGQLKEHVLQDALNMTKFARYLAGMSEDIRLSPALIESAQHKVVVLEKAYDPSDPHFPAKPADMSEAFYLASQGWTKSMRSFENLHYGRFPAEAVISFMDDPGEHNRYTLGHRRAIMYPDISEVGFGYTENYMIMHLNAHQNSDSWPSDRNYIAWPSPGYFPTLFANFEMFSIMLNPEKYEAVDPDSLVIEVLSKSQGVRWQLYATSERRSTAGRLYYSTQQVYGGNADFISFGVNDLDIKAGDEILVRITGIKDKNGNETSIEYVTRFFDLENKRDKQSVFRPIQEQKKEQKKEQNQELKPGLIIEPSNLALLTGEQAQLTVLVEDGNGAMKDVTREAKYHVDELFTPYFTVSDQGVVTGIRSTEFIAYAINVTYENWTGMFHVSVREPAAEFTDISGHWARAAIEWAAHRRIARGYADNTFRPNQLVSEAEFLAFFYRPRVDSAMIDPPNGYSGHWADQLYRYAKSRNAPVLGADDKTERAKPITRRRVAEIIAAADGVHFVGDAAIQYLLGKGYSQGKTSATIEGYKGDDLLTRAEALAFSYNLLEAIPVIKTRPEKQTPESELPPLP